MSEKTETFVEFSTRAIQQEDGVFRLPIEIHTLHRGWVVSTPGCAISFLDPDELVRSVHEMIKTYVDFTHANLMAAAIEEARFQASNKDRSR